MAVVVTAYVARRNEAFSEIRAGSVSIVDEHGRPLIRIGSTPREKGSGLIEFLNESGTSMMAMGIKDAHAAIVSLRARDGRDELVLGADDEKGLGITFRDHKRDSGLMLTNSEGIAGLGFLSPGGKIVLSMGVKPDGSALLTIRDTDGKELLQLPKP